jgi:TatD DNase family protein
MQLIDVHCHLQAAVYRDSIGEVITRSREAGVAGIINAATSNHDWFKCRELGNKYSECHFALGIHPWYIDKDDASFLASLEDSDFEGAVAIGEAGLDKKFANTDFATQIQIYRLQLGIARDRSLPVNLHCIGAFGELINELKKTPLKRGGIIHNFNGSPELAVDLIKHGLSFSLGGILTYRNSKKRSAMLKKIWPENFLLETDSPDIPPVERTGTVNEPSNILFNLKAASEILDVSEEIIAEQTTENAKRIFAV